MKKIKHIEADQVALEEVSENLVAIQMQDDKFLIDMDTLYDMAFRFAAFLSYLENREEVPSEKSERQIH